MLTNPHSAVEQQFAAPSIVNKTKLFGLFHFFTQESIQYLQYFCLTVSYIHNDLNHSMHITLIHRDLFCCTVLWAKVLDIDMSVMKQFFP